MTSSYTHILGCDISKDSIDIAIQDLEKEKFEVIKTCKNKTKGFREIESFCKNKSVHIVMEATGNYHHNFIEYLTFKGIAYSVVNPLSIKRYAQMKLQRTKTDKVDAKLISNYGKEQKPELYNNKNKIQKELKSLNTVLRNYIKVRTQLKNLVHSQELISPYSNEGLKSIKKMISNLEKEIEKIESKIMAKVKTEYSQTYDLISSVKGVGKRTTTQLIASIGDLRSFESSKKLASFIGINPALEQSGSSRNKTNGISKQGNPALRTLLYLSALSASRANKSCKELYERLLKKGKQKKTALIAVSNKLLKQIFAVVRDKKEFVNGYNLT